MSGDKRLKSSLPFKASETFMFLGTDEVFRTTVKLTASQLVRVRLHDFNASFTAVQAYNVGLGLIEAIINSNVYDESESDESRHQLNLKFCGTLIQRNELSGSTDKLELLHVVKTEKEFLIAGALLDPEPNVRFEGGEDPYYDLQIGLNGQHIQLSFGWVRWKFTKSETEWLAEQLLTAAFLATKPVGGIPREEP